MKRAHTDDNVGSEVLTTENEDTTTSKKQKTPGHFHRRTTGGTAERAAQTNSNADDYERVFHIIIFCFL